ncbi:ShlB/FhaC/HecB family hemolysin secretion/activation protein [Enterobacter sp.]|uniref:ShlB/FhaC/HecB family hemolysin secretion/activation protein n=1 Tax=Enterobacter sp. TaxID=42895 RepID=UPI00296EB052|nr:ShlB/FhaC/HecB family hemolysin secretion/activation protein [Enterobacter sp.]
MASLNKALLFVPFISLAHAAGPLPIQQNKHELDRLEKQNNQFLIEEAKRTEQFLQQQRVNRETDDNRNAGVNSTWTFKIEQIEILNDDLFTDAPQRESIIARYRGKALGKAEIFALVKELTDFYISRGYATTLIAIEPGNIKSGVLKLRVMWGKINEVKVNGQAPTLREKTRLFAAYPFSKDNVLNMQDIDQAVENLLRVSGQDNLQVQPSVLDGYSDLNLLHQPSFPLSMTVGLNNSGIEAEGWRQYYASLAAKNIAGLNDIFNAYYSWNDLDRSPDSQDALSLNYSIPLGYWSFDGAWYQSRYEKTLLGNNESYASDGDSERASLRVSRLLSRNATGKTSGWVKLEKRDNYNGIEHSQIDVSSKSYTTLSSGVTWVGALMDGWFYGDLGVSAAVPWFGAAWTGDKDLDGFDLDYVKYNGVASWTRPLFNLGRLGGIYELSSGFQYTPDVLVSDAKMSLGDEYTVRGFKDDTLLVDSGAWISNTLQFPFAIGLAGIHQFTPFVGYDFGFAKDNCPEGVNTCHSQFMMGASVGANLTGEYFFTSIMAGWPVKKPDAFAHQKTDNTVVYYKLELKF